ncbi:FKBP-type peptidyl-prolyl cis-trans isomerase [Bacteroidota bacterium]
MKCKQIIVKGFILIFIIIFFSCKREKEVNSKKTIEHSKESLEEVNKLLVDKDTELIKSYIERRGWDMNMTESGLWYMIYKKGSGSLIEKGNYITFRYNVSLLNGTHCYSSDEQGPKSFVVGKGGVESGLEEGVLMLQKGSKARFILAPHLAHGLIGDENRIPARATIIYDIKILKIED